MDADMDPEARKAPRKRPRAEAVTEGPNAKQARVDSSAVFIRGLPEGLGDDELRRWLEAQVGPTVTCYRIRDDYGLAKFKEDADALRCLEELKDAKLKGSTLRFEIAKPKRKSVQQRSSGTTAPAAAKPAGEPEGRQKKEDGLDLCDVLLKGIPSGMKREGLRTWVEEKLPGGCGIEYLRRAADSDGLASGAAASSFVVRFRREANARRAVEVLGAVELQGHKVSASFRALEMSRKSAKGGRLIVRNLAFGATEKHVRKAFAELGELAEVHLPLKNGQTASDGNGNPAHRGFAFVQYIDSSASERAVSELNGIKICGRGVAVDWAMDQKLYGTLHKEEERSQGKKKGEGKGEKTDDAAETGKDDRKTAKKYESKEENDDEESGEEEEDSEEESGSGKEAADEVRRMKQMLGEDGDSFNVRAKGPKVEKKVKETRPKADEDEEDSDSDEDKPKKDKGKRTSGYDVGEGRTLFVRNCPFDATEEELRKTFGKFGKIHSVKLVADKTGQNEHSGSVFIKYREADGLQKALAVEEDSDRKLKELSSVIKRSDQRDLAAVEGFGVAIRGRRLVLKRALAPGEVQEALDGRKPEKGKAKEERSSWMHLLHVGEINEHHEGWKNLSKSEKRQRAASMKERKFRINNSNFAVHPLRLSVRNLPRGADANKIREVLVGFIAQQSFVAAESGPGKKERRRMAEGMLEKIQLVRDTERRTEDNERRSKGFGFINFKDHRSAMAGLECLNDNPTLFGGGKRPIVEFAIEDKRKLRMQEELYDRHAHKLLGGKEPGKDAKGKGKGKGEGSKGKGEGKGKGDAKGESADDSAWKKIKHKKKKKEGMSRGRRQREAKRAKKAAEEQREFRKEAFEAKTQKVRGEKATEVRQNVEQNRKRSKRFEPDAGHMSKKPRTKTGELSDDFELRAMERFRGGKR